MRSPILIKLVSCHLANSNENDTSTSQTQQRRNVFHDLRKAQAVWHMYSAADVPASALHLIAWVAIGSDQSSQAAAQQQS